MNVVIQVLKDRWFDNSINYKFVNIVDVETGKTFIYCGLRTNVLYYYKAN